MPAPSVIQKGITTALWGTDSKVGTPSGAIVEKLTITPKNKDPIEVEDNNGFAAILVLLLDGFNAEATMVYDTAKTWPAEGDTIVLTVPKTGAAGGTEDFNCLLCSISKDMTRKDHAKITFTMVYRPGVDLA